MSPRADFYVTHTPPDQLMTMAIRILEKAYEKLLSTYVYVNSGDEAKQLDQLLWTYQDTAFLPHQLWSSGETVNSPILIGCESTLPTAQVFMNLTSQSLPGIEQFERVIEFVPEDESWKQSAREKYLYFQKHQWEINTHAKNIRTP